VFIAGLLSTIASGQWIKYPTEGVPRDKNGKPNLSAPAPRAPDGKPDLSGMWITAEGLPCPESLKDDTGDCLEKSPLSRFAADLNKAVPGGLPFQPLSLEILKQRQQSGLDPHVRCLPSNFPRMFTLPHITKFVQTRKLLLLINEYNASYRQIFMDGRTRPEVTLPAWYGYSTGKWEGDALVVDTIGFNDRSWLDDAGHPHTDALHTIERFTRPDFGHLRVQITIDDPKAYTKPWTETIRFELAADTEMLEDVCDNEKDAAHYPK